MKKLFIVANWKSNETILQSEEWFRTVNESHLTVNSEGKEVIVCPPFTLLDLVSSKVKSQKLNVKVGAQNISPFGEGAYTGEISAKQIREFAEYVIIGHSERRRNFFENEEIVNQKIEQAVKNNLLPIICVSDINQVGALKLKDVSKVLIAYEPLFAIGSGIADTPENANQMAKNIKDITKGNVLYGGSVDSRNVKTFTRMPYIDGVLVGKASLSSSEFLQIIKNA